VILRYRSGEEIMKGDRVLFHRNLAVVEKVSSDRDSSDPETQWHVKEFGGGVLILDPMVSGRTFLPASSVKEYEDLEFVERAKEL
jgi:hypothetical protein